MADTNGTVSKVATVGVAAAAPSAAAVTGGPPTFPVAAMQVIRDEVTNVTLEVLAGALPAGLTGHFFFIAPAGNVGQSGQVPDRQTLLNGDGMIYRVDFAGGVATGMSRMVKPLDWWCDEITHSSELLSLFRFHNAGISRLGLLGFRNFGNTALLPMLGAGGSMRFLATYDAGRPLEIDPATLATIAPVGANSEWVPAIPLPPEVPIPFPIILASAHPVWDPKTQEMFTANYTRSMESLLLPRLSQRWSESSAALGATAIGAAIGEMAASALHAVVDPVLGAIEKRPRLLGAWVALRELARDLAKPALEKTGATPSAIVNVVRWDGQGALQSLQVMLADGTAVEVSDSMHQIALSEDYVIFVDTNFKVGINQWTNSLCPSNPTFERFVRLLFAARQIGQMPIYFIKRSDIAAALSNGAKSVTATQSVLPYGAVHFLADYANPNGEVTIHAGHGSALDIAEWVRSFDVSPATAPTPVSPLITGMVAGEVDVSHMGRYKVNAATGVVTEARLCAIDPSLWGVSLYAGAGLPAWNALPERIEQIFWFSNGFWPELLTRYIYNLYKGFEGRMTPSAWIDSLAGTGAPPCLFRLDTQSMQITDRYALGENRILSSPQFIPAASGAWADGWVVCTVVGDEASELWVFSASNLAQGPLARLGSAAFPFAFTLHTAWMPEVTSPAARAVPDARADFAAFVARHPEADKLVEEAIARAAAASGL